MGILFKTWRKLGDQIVRERAATTVFGPDCCWKEPAVPRRMQTSLLAWLTPGSASVSFGRSRVLVSKHRRCVSTGSKLTEFNGTRGRTGRWDHLDGQEELASENSRGLMVELGWKDVQNVRTLLQRRYAQRAFTQLCSANFKDIKVNWAGVGAFLNGIVEGVWCGLAWSDCSSEV